MIKQKTQILAEAEAYTGVPRRVIMGRSRTNDPVMIRDAVCVAMKQALGLTDGSIAKAIGRDRSSISHAQRRHRKRVVEVDAYRMLYNHLLTKAQKGVAA